MKLEALIREKYSGLLDFATPEKNYFVLRFDGFDDDTHMHLSISYSNAGRTPRLNASANFKSNRLALLESTVYSTPITNWWEPIGIGLVRFLYSSRAEMAGRAWSAGSVSDVDLALTEIKIASDEFLQKIQSESAWTPEGVLRWHSRNHTDLRQHTGSQCLSLYSILAGDLAAARAFALELVGNLSEPAPKGERLRAIGLPILDYLNSHH
jgi:hypothetical protein